MERHFRVEVSTGGRAVVLTLHGELDLSSSAALDDELRRVEGVALVVVDLRALEFVDSTGLGVLVKAHQHMRDEGNRLALVEGEGQVSRLLKMSGLSEQLTIVDDLEALLDER